MNNETYLRLQELVAHAQTETAMVKLEFYCKDQMYYRKQYLLLKNRMSHLSGQQHKNLISPEEAERMQNRINDDLLALLDQVFHKKESSQKSIKPGEKLDEKPHTEITQNAHKIINIDQIEGDGNFYL